MRHHIKIVASNFGLNYKIYIQIFGGILKIIMFWKSDNEKQNNFTEKFKQLIKN